MSRTSGWIRKLNFGCAAMVTLGTIGTAHANGFETLYAFQGGTDGSQPPAGVVADASGNLYGTTSWDGTNGCSDCGTVFKLAPDGTETVLHDFGAFTGDGWLPTATVTLDPAGNVYGTTYAGGASQWG